MDVHPARRGAGGSARLAGAQADRLAQRLSRLSEVDHVDRLNHPDAIVIQPKQYGERFDLHAAVRALFDLEIASNQAA